jgi:hypothetical protein
MSVDALRWFADLFAMYGTFEGEKFCTGADDEMLIPPIACAFILMHISN